MNKKYTEIDYKNIGKRIRELRGNKNQLEFAKEFKLSQTDVSRVERGEIKASPELLYNICIIYGRPLSWLLTGEGEQTISQSKDEAAQKNTETPAADLSKTIAEAMFHTNKLWEERLNEERKGYEKRIEALERKIVELEKKLQAYQLSSDEQLSKKSA